ncbi:Protein yippee-like [Vigna angularis]|uniref:Protein yippee-like n=1 Tax=Phaseolus angularis TaxID=3914 RepID=A0A8T0KE50_PHAAN|nr:Protein yippee-like [Vigna angularis]
MGIFLSSTPSSSVNFTIGVLEERMMLSGLHTVADIFCCCCGQIVGWKYESAHERSQKYKEGKFVLESRGRIVDEIDFTAEFHIESCVSMSDAEDA